MLGRLPFREKVSKYLINFKIIQRDQRDQKREKFTNCLQNGYRINDP